MTLTRFAVLPLVLITLTSLAAAQAAPAPASDITVTAKARAIHDSALIIDTHADTPQRFLDEGFDIGSTDPNDLGHISLDKAKRGNLGAEFFSIWVEPETNQGRYAQAHVRSDRFGLRAGGESIPTA